MKLIGKEKYIGKFNVNSKELVIGDPCYDPGTWCLGNCKDVLNGTWVAKTLKADNNETGWGDRVSALFAFNLDYIEENFQLDDIDVIRFAKGTYNNQFLLDYTIGTLGVDSGQAGIYDYKHFLDVKNSDSDNKATWYDQNCDITLTDEMAGILPDKKGCVSSSGYGDGGYDYYCYYDKDGFTVAVLIVFIDNEEEIEEETEKEIDKETEEMKNKVYLVSKVICYSYETMAKEFKIFDDKNIAKAYFDTLVSDYIIDKLDYFECKNKEELEDTMTIDDESENLFTAVGGDEEIEIELSEMEVF